MKCQFTGHQWEVLVSFLLHIKLQRSVGVRLQVKEMRCFQFTNQRQSNRKDYNHMGFLHLFWWWVFWLMLLPQFQLMPSVNDRMPCLSRLLQVQVCGAKQEQGKYRKLVQPIFFFPHEEFNVLLILRLDLIFKSAGLIWRGNIFIHWKILPFLQEAWGKCDCLIPSVWHCFLPSTRK